MKHIVWFIFLISFQFPWRAGFYLQSPSPTIGTPVTVRAPLPGQALQGSVLILGTSAIESYKFAEISFGYQNDLTGTWFLVSESDQAVTDGEIANWDTTTISDGNYNLRLLVTLEDGSQVQALVHGLRVRNYSTIETDTPTAILPSATYAPGEASATATLTLTPRPPTATVLPTNPAEVSRQDVVQSIGLGGLAVLGLFAILGAYIGLRTIGKR